MVTWEGERGKPGLLALVEREKTVALRQAAAPRLVPLTALPEDATRLYETVPGGAPAADTVWLFSQGGLVTELDPSKVIYAYGTMDEAVGRLTGEGGRLPRIEGRGGARRRGRTRIDAR